MRQALVNGRILTDDGFVDGHCVMIDDGRISEVRDGIPADAEPFDLRGGTLLPGFIDVQINGAFGFDFSNQDCLTNPVKFRRDLHSLNQRLIQTGTTSYLPTMTSQFTKTYHHVCSPMNKKHNAPN